MREIRAQLREGRAVALIARLSAQTEKQCALALQTLHMECAADVLDASTPPPPQRIAVVGEDGGNRTDAYRLVLEPRPAPVPRWPT